MKHITICEVTCKPTMANLIHLPTIAIILLSLTIASRSMTLTDPSSSSSSSSSSSQTEKRSALTNIGCDTPWGESLQPWEKREVSLNGTCKVCFCDGGYLPCYDRTCPVVFCDNPITSPGDCSCPKCPGGPWCSISDGPTRIVDGLAKGERKWKGCNFCQCDDKGTAVCGTVESAEQCPPLLCVDKVVAPGACCPHCPKGQNCRIASTGEVINAGRKVKRGGEVCECPTLPVHSEVSMTSILRSRPLAEWHTEMTTAICSRISVKPRTISFVGDTV